jgi:hypothetical protein
MRILPVMSLALLATTLSGCGRQEKSAPEPSDMARRMARYAPVEITADVSRLSPGDRRALDHLVRAARLMDSLYLLQTWSGMPGLQDRLRADTSAAGRERFAFFAREMGPWSSLDEHEPFIPGVPAKPPHAAHYPDDMTKEEFTAWEASLDPAGRGAANGFFHAIRRDAGGKLSAVPYSSAYRPLLDRAASILREAAGMTDNATLQRFLVLRAEAFLSDDYYASDVAWMDLDSPIDVTIGPYETYMDELLNAKAAFEAFVTIRNEEESRRLQRFSASLQEIEDHLPIAPEYRNPKLGAMAPIRVVDVVVTGGEAVGGVQTAAFNLPNDERVIREKGSKRVMLKNVQEAKFRHVLQPIAARAVHPDQRDVISFDHFFTHILAHELVHGLGPHGITVGGRATTVRQELKELYSAMEEAKADVAGLFALQYLMDTGVIPREEERMYITFLAGIFRSVRFGITEAHGRGMALQFNYLLDAGAVLHDSAGGVFRVDIPRMREAVRALTGEIMTLQAEGDYARAKAMLDRLAVIRPAMRQVLDRCTDIPVDIAPRYPLAEGIAP